MNSRSSCLNPSLYLVLRQRLNYVFGIRAITSRINSASILAVFFLNFIFCMLGDYNLRQISNTRWPQKWATAELTRPFMN